MCADRLIARYTQPEDEIRAAMPTPGRGSRARSSREALRWCIARMGDEAAARDLARRG